MRNKALLKVNIQYLYIEFKLKKFKINEEITNNSFDFSN